MAKISFIVLAIAISTAASARTGGAPSAAIQAIEQRIGGRLGVAALDVNNGRCIEYRSTDRFRMGSTFKLVLVGHVLSRVDSGKEKLDRAIPYSATDLLEYAPLTSKRVSEKQITVKDLSVAILQYSDNTAANLLLRTLGGPEGFAQFLREIGD